MIYLKTDREIEIMKRGGEKLARTLNRLFKYAKAGVSLLELDRLAEKWLLAEGGKPSFKGYQGFPRTICVSVNDGLVHGIPDDYKLQEEDLLTIDIGILFEGFHTDMARTKIIVSRKEVSKEKKRFLEVGKESLEKAISKAEIGNQVGDISQAMQEVIESASFSVSRIFTGHGIGRELHERPIIPCFGEKGTGEKLKRNMVIAIEVIYAAGLATVKTDKKDNWTTRTIDGSWGGLFENTVAITEKGPLVLTRT